MHTVEKQSMQAAHETCKVARLICLCHPSLPPFGIADRRTCKWWPLYQAQRGFAWAHCRPTLQLQTAGSCALVTVMMQALLVLAAEQTVDRLGRRRTTWRQSYLSPSPACAYCARLIWCVLPKASSSPPHNIISVCLQFARPSATALHPCLFLIVERTLCAHSVCNTSKLPLPTPINGALGSG
jgi:hypothetical protein